MGPYQIIRMMSQAKQANDLHTNSLSQQALYQLCTNFNLDGHIEQLISVYRSRMEVMVDCLQKADLPELSFVKKWGLRFA